MELKDRIKAIMLFKGIKSENNLSKEIGLTQRMVNYQLSGRSSVSIEFVNAILGTYPDISAEWLLRGKGEMLISQQPHQTQNVLGNGNVVGNNIVNSEVSVSTEPTKEELASKMEELQRMFNKIMCK